MLNKKNLVTFDIDTDIWALPFLVAYTVYEVHNLTFSFLCVSVSIIWEREKNEK